MTGDVAEAQGAAAPTFSLIVAVYNVSRYLPRFIDSIERQSHPLGDVEVIVVDDGSTDDSLARLHEWRQRRPELVRVLAKSNGGQGSARNAGLGHARGSWLTFPDPDDTLAADYLEHVASFLAREPSTQLVATKRVVVSEETGQRHNHALHGHFKHGDRLRDLDEHPTFFHGSAPAAFFRRDIVESTGLRFDERIRPNFEDGHFCSRYLMQCLRPLVGFVSAAEYFYLKRADGSSTLNISRADPGRYTAVLEHGYLGLFQEARRRYSSVPEWLQNFVLYELSWYFQDEESGASHEILANGAVAERFHNLFAQIVGFFDPTVVDGFAVRRFDPVWRDIVQHAYEAAAWHTPYVVVDKVDGRQRLMRVVYRYTHARPSEELLADGVKVDPDHKKDRGLSYFGRIMMNERIIWLPLGDLRVNLNGAKAAVLLDEPPRPGYAIRRQDVARRLLRRRPRPQSSRKQPTAPRQAMANGLLVRAASTGLARRAFAHAWVLMDRVADADDSAEHLFRHLRAKHRGTNAWFVVGKDSADYRRLRKDGYRRVVPHGSLRWKLLMLNCDHVLSSHVDAEISAPPSLAALGKPWWRFTFLQHGVITDDVSRLLNPKDVDLLITSTRAEYHSIVDDGTSYRYTDREVALTGSPHFDRLLEASAQISERERDLVLIAPAQGSALTTGPDAGRRHVVPDVFAESSFARNWLALLRSEELASCADRHGLRVGLLVHPDLHSALRLLPIPKEVLTFSSTGAAIREAVARARVVVTDYSPAAFSAAYLRRPIVYFHFDRAVTRRPPERGHFDYERLGFGPVTDSVEAAATAAIDSLERGSAPTAEYARRMDEAFAFRDGNASERVFQAIRVSVGRERAG